tara:strand:+ start:6955 stop:7878 length:924 start_codon:yes stop_codon:yes gene_type:complete
MDLWKKEGYCLLSNIIDSNTLNKSTSFLKTIYNAKSSADKDFGSEGKLEFPTGKIIDKITLNESIIDIVENLLDDKVLLTQADTWSKYGTNDFSEKSNNNQRMHMDYGNNSFLHPSSWDNPEAVAAIIYFTDTYKTGGGTRVVPNTYNTKYLYQPPYTTMPGIQHYKFFNDKQHAETHMQNHGLQVLKFREELYKHEIELFPTIGDILFYRLDLWHRGTPVYIDQHRITMNLVWKKKSATWINQWNPGWSKKMYYSWLEKEFIQMTPKQRSILGVPYIGDKYWTKTTLSHLKARYPNININPYMSKL